MNKDYTVTPFGKSWKGFMEKNIRKTNLFGDT